MGSDSSAQVNTAQVSIRLDTISLLIVASLMTTSSPDFRFTFTVLPVSSINLISIPSTLTVNGYVTPLISIVFIALFKSSAILPLLNLMSNNSLPVVPAVVHSCSDSPLPLLHTACNCCLLHPLSLSFPSLL